MCLKNLVGGFGIEPLQRLAIELPQRQPAAFADIVNGELVAEMDSLIQIHHQVTILQIGANAGIVLLCQHRKRTSVAQE